MHAKQKIRISVTIMAIGVMLSIYSIITSQTDLYNVSVLIFLIGITISNIVTCRLLKEYQQRYGSIEGDE